MAVVVAILLKGAKSPYSANCSIPVAATMSESAATPVPATPATPAKLPRLLDLGATKCIPCKLMVPILDELKQAYAGKLQVEFIDVWQNQAAGQQYGVEMIPTQIFFDAAGKELFRHSGFFSKDEILAKWRELGVAL